MTTTKTIYFFDNDFESTAAVVLYGVPSENKEVIGRNAKLFPCNHHMHKQQQQQTLWQMT